MPRLLVKIGQNFGSNTWHILFGNKTHNFPIECCHPFEFTHPMPGNVIKEDEIKELIDFLQQTLEEKESHEQSNLE